MHMATHLNNFKKNVSKTYSKYKCIYLHIDNSKSIGLSSANDGSATRRVIKNLELFPKVTDVNKDVIRHFYLLLTSDRFRKI